MCPFSSACADSDKSSNHEILSSIVVNRTYVFTVSTEKKSIVGMPTNFPREKKAVDKVNILKENSVFQRAQVGMEKE